MDGIESAFDAYLAALSELDYDEIPGSPDDLATDLAWMRQYCSEYGAASFYVSFDWSVTSNSGFYQRGDASNPLSIETSLLSLDLFQQQCDETFSDSLPSWPEVGNINKYGGWDMNPSNVMFANGECKCHCTSFLFLCNSHSFQLILGEPWVLPQLKTMLLCVPHHLSYLRKCQ